MGWIRFGHKEKSRYRRVDDAGDDAAAVPGQPRVRSVCIDVGCVVFRRLPEYMMIRVC